jgi:hypothetical protein
VPDGRRQDSEKRNEGEETLQSLSQMSHGSAHSARDGEAMLVETFGML